MERSGVSVIVKGLEENPRCIHGPTLLFRRNGKKSKEYYACSACRDSKDCSFYQEASKNIKTRQEMVHPAVIKLNHKQMYKKYLQILNSDEEQRTYCLTCSKLFLKPNKKHLHCQRIEKLTCYQLKHPTEIFVPKENTKKEAQYFFSKQSVLDIISILSKLGFKRVLCMGTPRIHEYILNAKRDMESILLDFDFSYHNFYSPSKFIWFNMFNNHIFDDSAKPTLHEFLCRKGRAVLLMDPPFGGRVEPLAYTFKKLNDIYKTTHGKKLSAFWFFPYFMEPHIASELPSFKMADYKVDYTNHKTFTGEIGGRKGGSPVRIFTNVSLKKIDLSSMDGYRFCEKCRIWVTEDNLHCDSCGICPSKNGRTYKHCDICRKCVKPSFVHCAACERCALANHVCGQFVPDTSCYHCHEEGHKKRDCPKSQESGRRKKQRKK